MLCNLAASLVWVWEQGDRASGYSPDIVEPLCYRSFIIRGKTTYETITVALVRLKRVGTMA